MLEGNFREIGLGEVHSIVEMPHRLLSVLRPYTIGRGLP